ncbi:enolase C-terminal domain-like protein [Pseudorhizobium tarimense]|uniref:enolase C-terminal domain-like protein n=1 Tax=Pseudorhizobium tarimense TaxID=1079109 RepID=UPI0035E3E95D
MGGDSKGTQALGPICSAATIHLAAAIRNLAYVECWETPNEGMARQNSSIFVQRPQSVGANYPVPDQPRLGIEVDEGALDAAEPFRFSEMPHISRRDGSVTNW